MNKDNVTQYALAIYDAVLRLFDPDDEDHRFDLTKINANEFFTAQLLAFNLLFSELTQDEDHDLIDSLHVMTRLAFQYLEQTPVQA